MNVLLVWIVFFLGGGGAVVGMWHHGKIAACNVRFMRGGVFFVICS